MEANTDYQEHSKHCTLYLEGVENRGNFSGAAQPDDDVKLMILNFAGATKITHHGTVLVDTCLHYYLPEWEVTNISTTTATSTITSTSTSIIIGCLAISLHIHLFCDPYMGK